MGGRELVGGAGLLLGLHISKGGFEIVSTLRIGGDAFVGYGFIELGA